jgi:hypothetical protein
MSAATLPFTEREIRGIKWVYRCSDVRMTGEAVEGFKFVVLIGASGNWERLGTRDEVLRRVNGTIAAHNGFCPGD